VLSAPGVLIVRGKLSELYAEMWGFGHLPACNWLARPARRGWGLGGRRAFAARNRRPGKKIFTALSDFTFRGQGDMRHARQNVWPYMRRDITLSGVLKSLRRTEARGASANSIRPARAASISWQLVGMCANKLSLATQWYRPIGTITPITPAYRQPIA
jgi:hypothetical protein